jgi:hypothetical protein
VKQVVEIPVVVVESDSDSEVVVKTVEEVGMKEGNIDYRGSYSNSVFAIVRRMAV